MRGLTRMGVAGLLLLGVLAVVPTAQAAEECAAGMQSVVCSNMGTVRTCMVTRNASAGGMLSATVTSNVNACVFNATGTMVMYTASANTMAPPTRICIFYVGFPSPACCTCTIDMNSTPNGLPVELLDFEVDGAEESAGSDSQAATE